MGLIVNEKGQYLIMNIAFYRWKDTDLKTRSRIMKRAQADIDAVVPLVQPIIESVRKNGDAALVDYARKFDKAEVKSLKATDEDFARAKNNLSEELKAAIRKCADNVRLFHEE